MHASRPHSARFRHFQLLLIGLILIGGTSVGLWKLLAEDLSAPSAQDRHVTRIVTDLLQREHISKQEIDDEIAHRGVNLFLRSLDPMKLYFNQSDIDEFKREKDQLATQIREGDISFAYRVYNRFLQRVDERLEIIKEMIDTEHDFTVDEYLITDRDEMTYAQNGDEVRDRWRKRIKYDLLMLKADTAFEEDPQERLHRRYNNFARRMHQLSGDELLERYLSSITSSFDPHTSYMSPSTLENFRILMRLNLEGIGAALQAVDGYTVVSQIIPGGAAERHGKLKPEDRIVAVGQGEDGEMVDVIDMKLNDVVNMIRGPAGTSVRLAVTPTGSTETQIYTITREKVELEDSAARAEILEEGQKSDGSPYRIGFIDLPSFYMDMEAARDNQRDYRSTTRDVRILLERFNEENVDAVVLDLRRNGGGSLTEAISLTGLFIDQGPVVQVQDSDNRIQHYDDLDRGMAWRGPLVVITSKFSASASEIFAGAIQDYRRGIVIGDESTHGKGTVQSLVDLGSQVFRIRNARNLGALKVTMQKFYRPSGDSTQKRGILSDIVLPSMSNELDIAEADMDYAIEFDTVPAMRFDKYAMVSPDLVAELRTRSAERRQQCEDFQKLLRRIEQYHEQREAKKVSLNEEAFFAERAEFDADREEEKQYEQQQQSNDNVVERDYYVNEVLNIAVDYIQALGDERVARIN